MSKVYFTTRERLVILSVVLALLVGTVVWHIRRQQAADRIAEAAAQAIPEKSPQF